MGCNVIEFVDSITNLAQYKSALLLSYKMAKKLKKGARLLPLE